MPGDKDEKEDQKSRKDSKAVDPFVEDSPKPDVEAKKDAPETKTQAEPKHNEPKPETGGDKPAGAPYEYPNSLNEAALTAGIKAEFDRLESKDTKEAAEANKKISKMYSAEIFQSPLNSMPMRPFLDEKDMESEILFAAECFSSPIKENIEQEFKTAGDKKEFAEKFFANISGSVAKLNTMFVEYDRKESARIDAELEIKSTQDLEESANDVIVLASATPDPVLHAGEDAKPSLTASAEVTETETERLEENKKAEEVAQLQADAKAEAEVEPGIVKNAEEHLSSSDIDDDEEEDVSSETQEAVREKTAEEASDDSTMEKLKRRLQGIWKKSADAKKNTATDKAAVSATGDDTSLTPEKDKKSKATSENKARLNLDQLKAEFLRAIREHNENSPSATVDYELVDSTKNSFNIKDKNDGGAELGTVEIKRDKSIEYTFSKPVDANFVDVVLRSSKDKVFRLHSTKPKDIEEILKAAAIAGKIIKFDDATEDYVKRLEASGALDSYPTLKARVEEDAKPASQKAAELALAKSATAHPKPK